MSKYNNIKSIPIASIPKEELQQAIKEWAEGNDCLETLLKNCIKNKVETHGCHAGKCPYLDIKINNSYNKVKNMIYSVQNIDGVKILVTPDGGNPRSSDDFYKSGINISFLNTTKKSETDIIFTKMNDSLGKANQEEGIFDPLLDYYKFFEEKESGLSFFAKYESNTYTFNITSFNDYNIDYFDNLFKKCNLKRFKNDKTPAVKNRWGFTSHDPIEFNNKMKHYYNLIINNWSLEIPNTISEDMDLHAIARIKRRQFGTSPDGIKKFKEWLEEETSKSAY